jgi:hypothetical protein
MPKTLEQSAKIRGWDLPTLRVELGESRAKLRAVRGQRVPPGKDDKVLVSWNGLMIDAMARGGAILRKDRYLTAARRAANLILSQMRRADQRLLHSWRLGVARYDAYLDDYTHLANALVTLYEATFDETWIDQAVSLVDQVRTHFADREAGGFFFTATDPEPLIARQKDTVDNSIPSGNGMAATVMARLGYLCGRADYLCAARETVDHAAAILEKYPTAAGQLLIALDLLVGPTQEIAILGDPADDRTQRTVAGLRRRFIPRKVTALRSEASQPDASERLDPIFTGRCPGPTPPTVFVCQGFVCGAPLRGPDAAEEMWQKLAKPGQVSS